MTAAEAAFIARRDCATALLAVEGTIADLAMSARIVPALRDMLATKERMARLEAMLADLTAR